MCAPIADQPMALTAIDTIRLGHAHPDVNAKTGSTSAATSIASIARIAMRTWLQKSNRWRISFDPDRPQRGPDAHADRRADQHRQIVGRAAARIVVQPQLGGVPGREQQAQEQRRADAAGRLRHPRPLGRQRLPGAAHAQPGAADLHDVAGGEPDALARRDAPLLQPGAVDGLADHQLQRAAVQLAQGRVPAAHVGIVEDDVAGDGAADGHRPALHRQRDPRLAIAIEDVDDGRGSARPGRPESSQRAVGALVHRKPSR